MSRPRRRPPGRTHQHGGDLRAQARVGGQQARVIAALARAVGLHARRVGAQALVLATQLRVGALGVGLAVLCASSGKSAEREWEGRSVAW